MNDRADDDNGLSGLKVPPHSIEAEQSVLGGLMLNNGAWEIVADRVQEQDFYRTEHRAIFRAITALADRNEPFDAVTVSEWLERHDRLEDAGGMSYLAALATDTPSVSNIRAYADIVRERGMMRDMISVGGEIIDMAYLPSGRVASDVVEHAEQRIFVIGERGARALRSSDDSIGSAVTQAVEQIDEAGEGIWRGVKSGLKDLDEMCGGFHDGDLVVWGARPSMGKTSLMCNFIVGALREDPKMTVGLISSEQPKAQIAMRLMAIQSNVSIHGMRTGEISQEEWAEISKATKLTGDLNLKINDHASITTSQIVRQARIWKSRYDIKALYIDYLQRIRPDNYRLKKHEHIEELCVNLKGIARDLDIPVIALAQVNRDVEKRQNKRPMMADLSDSSNIEKEADMIGTIYRDEVYHPNTKLVGIAELGVVKQRHGPIGTALAAWIGRYTRFADLDQSSRGAAYGVLRMQ